MTRNLIEISIGYEENWQTVCNGKFDGKHCKIRKKGNRRKNTTLLCVTLRRMIQADLNFFFNFIFQWADLSFKQQSHGISFRLCLYNFRMPILKATVTKQNDAFWKS